MNRIAETFLKMVDTQKEWIGWIFAGLTVWIVVQVMGMEAPHEGHMKALLWVLVTTISLVSAKALVEIVNAIKGITKP